MADDDLHVPRGLELVARRSWLVRSAIAIWREPPRGYQLTRSLILRLVGVVYVFAFLGLIFQGLPLLGAHGLTPIASYVAHATFVDLPTVFVWNSSDAAIQAWAWLGLAIAISVALGYANLPMLLVLWAIYGSYERVGQLWFAFGWEIQLLETTLVAAVLAHPWDPRPLAARQPPTTAIVLMRWLAFRIMLGAGLIKLRGSSCWADLTCLDAHFETQPIPNPLSAWFHHLPHWVHATGVVLNHLVEVVCPFFVFGPRRLRLVAGGAMAVFQIALILSGNLAFLNWLTLVPILACFDDDFLLAMTPHRVRDWLRARIPLAARRDRRQLAIALGASVVVFVIWPGLFGAIDMTAQLWLAVGIVTAIVVVLAFPSRTQRSITGWVAAPGNRLDGHQLAVACFAALVIVKSWPVVDNLTANHQAMNRSYDRLALVNTYGAFGSVDMVRHEIVIEGTLAADPSSPEASWRAYELPCKPGDLRRQPCILGPYHRRLDWLIWFSAMADEPRDPWIFHLVWKLLDGDRTIRELLAVDPWNGVPPQWVRIRRFVYHLEPYRSDTWWTRDSGQLWLAPLSRDTAGFQEVLRQYGWPSPSQRD